MIQPQFLPSNGVTVCNAFYCEIKYYLFSNALLCTHLFCNKSSAGCQYIKQNQVRRKGLESPGHVQCTMTLQLTGDFQDFQGTLEALNPSFKRPLLIWQSGKMWIFKNFKSYQFIENKYIRNINHLFSRRIHIECLLPETLIHFWSNKCNIKNKKPLYLCNKTLSNHISDLW